jgi:hypothetical protein
LGVAVGCWQVIHGAKVVRCHTIEYFLEAPDFPGLKPGKSKCPIVGCIALKH